MSSRKTSPTQPERGRGRGPLRRDPTGQTSQATSGSSHEQQ
jgi:hypothetical protein